MKHKAQEALDDISNILYTTDYVEHIRCQSYPIMEDEQAVIKQLLDCQLTVDEIKTLLHIYKIYCIDRDIPFMSSANIVCKLNKQKEMWEEE